MYTHLILQGHLGNMDLLFFSSFLFSFNWSIQTPADRWGQGPSSLKTHARYEDFFSLSETQFHWWAFVFADLLGFSLMFPIRNLDARATWTIVRRQPLLSPIHVGVYSFIWIVKGANWIANLNLSHHTEDQVDSVDTVISRSYTIHFWTFDVQWWLWPVSYRLWQHACTLRAKPGGTNRQ